MYFSIKNSCHINWNEFSQLTRKVDTKINVIIIYDVVNPLAIDLLSFYVHLNMVPLAVNIKKFAY